MHCRYFDTTRNGDHSSFLTPTLVGRQCPFPVKYSPKVTNPYEKCRLRPISIYNVSKVKDNKKVQLWRILSWPRAFQWAIDGVCTLTLCPERVAQKTIFFRFFGIKVQFNQIKCATKFLCVKTSSSKVVVWPRAATRFWKWGGQILRAKRAENFFWPPLFGQWGTKYCLDVAKSA